MARDGDATKLQILRTAERLFVERGVEGPSLFEISAASGQKNHSAATYHFGTKEALVDAILERHSAPIHRWYDVAMDALATRPDHTLRDLVELLVLPIVAKLDDPDGGRAYLSMCAQLAVSPSMPLELRPVASTPAVRRIIGAMIPFLRTDPTFVALRMARISGTLYLAIVQYERLSSAGATAVSRAVFAGELVDCLTTMLRGFPAAKAG